MKQDRWLYTWHFSLALLFGKIYQPTKSPIDNTNIGSMYLLENALHIFYVFKHCTIKHYVVQILHSFRVQSPGFLRILFHLFTPFKGPLSPTSQCPMSKLFRYSQSLSKSNRKKWSQIWKLLFIKGVKSLHKKNLVGKFIFVVQVHQVF